MIKKQEDIRVRYAETDKMGMVYHGSYLPWLEAARIRLLDEIGIPYRDLEANGYFLPVLEVSLKYLKPIQFDDRISITVTLSEIPKVRIVLTYEIRRNDELMTTAESQHAFIDKKGQLLRPPRTFLLAIEPHF